MKTYTEKEFIAKIEETFARWKKTDYKNKIDDLYYCFGWSYEDACVAAYDNGNCDFGEEYGTGLFTQNHMDIVLQSLGSYFDEAEVYVREGKEDHAVGILEYLE